MSAAGGKYLADYTTVYGGPVWGGARSLAQLAYTKQQLAQEHPGCKLLVIQSAFNSGVAASAGTHNEDCCYDVQIDGLSWDDTQEFLDSCGWASFNRYPPLFPLRHNHMASIPEGLPAHPSEAQVLAAYTRMGIKVGAYVPRQVSDAMGQPPRNGLAGHAVDHADRPNPFWVFNYGDYLRESEMKLSEALDEELSTLSERYGVTPAYVARAAISRARLKERGPIRARALLAAATALRVIKK